MLSGINWLFSCSRVDTSARPVSCRMEDSLGVAGVLGVLSSVLDVRLFTGDSTLRW